MILRACAVPPCRRPRGDCDGDLLPDADDDSRGPRGIAGRIPSGLLRIEAEIQAEGVETLGLYGVLGEYDFVSVVEARDNESIAQFSLELGVRAGAHITSMPAIPIGRFERNEPRGPGAGSTGVELELPEAVAGFGDGDPPGGARV